MSFLAFAQEHIRRQMPKINPEVARCVCDESFTLHKQSHGRSLVFFNHDGQPAIIYKATRSESLNDLLNHAVKCARKSESRGFRIQPIYDSGQFCRRAYMVLGWLPGKSLQNVKKVLTCDDPLLKTAIETITQLHCFTIQDSVTEFPDLKRRVQEWNELLLSLPFVPASVRGAIKTTLS